MAPLTKRQPILHKLLAPGPWHPLHSPGAVLAHDHPLYPAISFSTEYAHPQQIASVSDSIAMTFFTKEF